MQFMLMCCFDESRWNALPASQREDIMQAYEAWVGNQSAAGCYLGGGKLDVSQSGTSVRGTADKPVIKPAVIDGPFAEAREQIGGYHIIECEDQEAAVRIASSIPTLPAGGTIEVRPLLRTLA